MVTQLVTDVDETIDRQKGLSLNKKLIEKISHVKCFLSKVLISLNMKVSADISLQQQILSRV